MLAVLTVVLVVAMCATPLVLLLRDIAGALRRPAASGSQAAVPAAPAGTVEYIASRPVLPLR